jgi:hypothetical protein
MPEARARTLATLAAAVLLLFLLLIQPNHPAAATPGALLRFPLELPALVILLVLARGRWRTALRLAATAALVLMALVKLADIGAYVAYVRAFNPLLDLHLLPASWRLLSGATGAPLAVAAAAATALAAAGLAAAAWWATGRIARTAPPAALRPWLAAIALPALLLAGLDAARELRPFDPPGTAFTSRLAWEHLRDGWRARRDIESFRAEAARDAFAALPPERLLTGLGRRDVILIFVESYGRGALDNPRYAPTVRGVLADAEAALGVRGLAMRSGWLESPVVGGQSWLAHASLLSGLRIDHQGRYQALLASPRRTLLHLARAAGWRTVAVMPAITLAWPEAEYFGYDEVLAAADLGYRGRPFNWVTMPDQFTLGALERAELAEGPRRPVFAEVALISSHAPWTPIPPILPWDRLGDGRVFDAFAASGDPPGVIWRDHDRVREQYRQAIEYTLRVVAAFAERRAGDGGLMVVLGDHQPVGFVGGDVGGRAVPVHLIGDPATLGHVADWGWTEGMIPAADVPVWPMHDFRDRFLTAFGPRAPAADSAALAP